MPTADYSSYHQAQGTTSDGNKFDNFVDAVQATVNGLDNNNIAIGAAIAVAKLAGPYTGYTPTLSASGGGAPAVGNGSIVGRYLQIGKLVHYTGKLVLGSTTSFGTGSLWISLPVTAASNGINLWGHGYGFDSSALALAPLVASIITTSTFALSGTTTHNGPNATVSGTVPFPWSWAAPDELNWNLFYEAA